MITASDTGAKPEIFSCIRRKELHTDHPIARAMSLDGERERAFSFSLPFVPVEMTNKNSTVRFSPPTVCFSVNGRPLGVKPLPVSTKYVPCIGVSSRGTVLQTNLGKSPFLFPPSPAQQLVGGICEALSHALDNEHYFPDVCFTFAGSGRTILAHKAVLVVRSLQFEVMFEAMADAAAPTEMLTVPVAADPRLFGRLLKFIYRGSLRLRDKVYFRLVWFPPPKTCDH